MDLVESGVAIYLNVFIFFCQEILEELWLRCFERFLQSLLDDGPRNELLAAFSAVSSAFGKEKRSKKSDPRAGFSESELRRHVFRRNSTS